MEAQEPQLFLKFKRMLDKFTPHVKERWAAFFALLTIYLLRVFFINPGWALCTYFVSIYILNRFVLFLTPIDSDENSTILPSYQDTEFKPFERKLSEFKFWKSVMAAIVIGNFVAFFRFLDLPVFWQLLLAYFVLLFAVTMKDRLLHMWKHGYVPWDYGRKRVYGDAPVSKSGSALLGFASRILPGEAPGLASHPLPTVASADSSTLGSAPSLPPGPGSITATREHFQPVQLPAQPPAPVSQPSAQAPQATAQAESDAHPVNIHRE